MLKWWKGERTMKKIDFQLVVSLFKGWTAGEVLDTLCTVFNETHQMICIAGFWTPIIDVYDMADIYYDSADSITVRFAGGPPSKPGLYEGNLTQLLMDRFLSAYYAGDRKKVTTVIKMIQNEKSRILSA
jgi:hypothetical protein